MGTFLFVHKCKFNGNNNASKPELLPKDEFGLNYQIWMVGPNELVSSTANTIAENATLSGPNNNPHTDIRNAGNSYFNSKEFKLNFSRGTQFGSFLPFNAGEYKLTIDNKNFSFHYSNINTINYWVLVIPTLHTNAANVVTNITLEYRFADGQIVDPRRLMKTGIQVQMGNNGNGQPLIEIRSQESSPTDLDYDYYNIVIENPIKLSDVGSLGLSYIDLFGNNCGNQWNAVLRPN